MNAEYEYYHFNDTDILDFICKFYPQFAAVYQTIVPGAMRADIWRLAIVLKYGGIYVDSDAFTTVSFRDYIWSNASMVTGLGRSKNIHQWVLMYTPNHEVIARALDIAINKTKHLYHSKQISMRFAFVKTTAWALHTAAMEIFGTIYNCSHWIMADTGIRESEFADNLTEHCCHILDEIAEARSRCKYILQVYRKDEVGGRLHFKQFVASREMYAGGVVRYNELEKKWHTLFQNVTCSQKNDDFRSVVRIGKCPILSLNVISLPTITPYCSPA